MTSSESGKLYTAIKCNFSVLGVSKLNFPEIRCSVIKHKVMFLIFGLFG